MKIRKLARRDISQHGALFFVVMFGKFNAVRVVGIFQHINKTFVYLHMCVQCRVLNRDRKCHVSLARYNNRCTVCSNNNTRRNSIFIVFTRWIIHKYILFRWNEIHCIIDRCMPHTSTFPPPYPTVKRQRCRCLHRTQTCVHTRISPFQRV